MVRVKIAQPFGSNRSAVQCPAWLHCIRKGQRLLENLSLRSNTASPGGRISRAGGGRFPILKARQDGLLYL